MVKCYYRVDGEERNQAGLGAGGTDLSCNFVSTADSATVLLGDILETALLSPATTVPQSTVDSQRDLQAQVTMMTEPSDEWCQPPRGPLPLLSVCVAAARTQGIRALKFWLSSVPQL